MEAIEITGLDYMIFMTIVAIIPALVMSYIDYRRSPSKTKEFVLSLYTVGTTFAILFAILAIVVLLMLKENSIIIFI